MEDKLARLGGYFRALGTIVFLTGILLTIFDVSGGMVVLVIGLMSAIQGSLMVYVFKD